MKRSGKRSREPGRGRGGESGETAATRATRKLRSLKLLTQMQIQLVRDMERALAEVQSEQRQSQERE